jgi:hypothetical protein
MGDDFIAAERLTRDDLLVEFRGDSADGGVLVRPHVLHYRIAAGDRVQRIGPVALAPRDFVDEWMRSGWDEARAWTDGKARAALGALRARLGDRPYGEFDPERRCRSDPTLWQIGFTPEREGRALPPVYFRIRWMPPYRFTLMGAGSRPLAGCDRVEPRPDEPGTLFPLQGWRGE